MLSQIDIEKLPSYQIGIEHGVAQGLEQGAMSALCRGMSIEEIIAIFGLSRETIKTLLSKIEKEWSTTYQQPRADGWVGWIKERSDGSTDNGSGG